jgi:DNA sulfur modification protein DndD
MQLRELRLENWGPFFGEHTIHLAVDPTAPVVLFRGENMRGKTSLLRAIVWSLYGQLREQDGRTALPVEKMVNLDALQLGETAFGVTLKFSHGGGEYTLHRSGVAVQDQPDRVQVSNLAVDLIPSGGLPFPAATIPEVIDGILSRDISDFFLFDGEMLNRFEERLREERATAQGFVRAQVERALGLPFMSALGSDLDSIQDALTATMEQVLRKARKQNGLSEKFQAKKDELEAKDADLAKLRQYDDELTSKIAGLDAQLSKVDEIKDLYYERKNLEREVSAAEDTIKDYRDSIADLAEANWWLPAAEILVKDFAAAESEIEAAEDADRERFKVQYRIDQIERQIGTGVCPTCGQPVAVHNEAELTADLDRLRAELAAMPATSVDEARRKRDRLRRFSNAASTLERVHEQEQDLSRERMRNDKRLQKIRQISESISGENVDIESLERNLVEQRTLKSRTGTAIAGLEEERAKLKQEVNSLGAQIADQPEVDESERRLQRTVTEAQEIVAKSFDRFRAAMRGRVSAATSELFRRLTTEKEYSGVSISEDYLLSVVDHEHRALTMISAGANQILTMAFIGALAECSADEAPMVMDTPFGRLDTGHRDAILEWVSTFDKQVILFVQSGEYDPQRNAHLLHGKIGREYTIERLSPTRSEVRAA